MKKYISSKELIDGAKSWLASLSDEEWCTKLEEENYFNELDEKQRLEWLNKNTVEFQYELDNIKYGVAISDEENFDYTSQEKLISSSMPITYQDKKVLIDSKAA
ncbi:MAG: hypothetical protein JW770_01150 [Actinobacteria bacterium]|nr:hypothetical protein [Actinomycetota bacterium]